MGGVVAPYFDALRGLLAWGMTFQDIKNGCLYKHRRKTLEFPKVPRFLYSAGRVHERRRIHREP